MVRSYVCTLFAKLQCINLYNFCIDTKQGRTYIRVVAKLTMLAARNVGANCRLLGTFLRALSNQVPKQEVPYEVTLKGKEVSTPVDVPKEADVVIIGGGSLGCQTLYNLVKLGITNVVLLEAHKLTSGTTWHSAGLVWRPRLNDVDIQLVDKTREIITSLEKETGVDPGFVQSGLLWIAKSKERYRELQRAFSLSKSLGIDGHAMSPREAKELCPIMNVEDIYGSFYYPEEGTVEPAGLCSALTRFATKKGAKILEKCPVTDIRTELTLFDGKQVTEVVTPFGTIKTHNVVNATGAWANYITNMVGVTIPLVPMKHAYFVTDKIPGMQKNMVSVKEPDSLLYVRPHGNSLVIGGFEHNPILLDKVDKDFHFGMYDFDYDVYSFYMEEGINRFPVLEKVGVKSTVCGPESFTPDHKAIMGEDPKIRGFFHCCGLNSTGIQFGGGCGHQMALWVAKGRPELDMFNYDIRRFHPQLIGNKTWSVERTHESFAKTYAIIYSHEEALAGRNQKLSPLHDILLEKGCVFQERFGWEIPGWFNVTPSPVQPYDWYGKYGHALSQDTRYKDALSGDYTYDFPTHQKYIQAECEAARTRAVIFDMSSSGQIYLTGPDSQEAADWLFTAEMRRESGGVVSTLVLNHRAGIEASLSVSIIGESDKCDWEPITSKGFYFTVGASFTLQTKAQILKELRQHLWDVDLIDCSDKLGILSLQGPKSTDILQEVADVQLDNVPVSTHKIVNIAGHTVRVFRDSSIGEHGWEIHAPRETITPIYKELHRVGEKQGLKDCGYRALDSLTCEKGSISWHAEIRSDDTPIEAGLLSSCKLDNMTPFLGRKALNVRLSEKLKKRLITLVLQDSSIALNGLEGILRDGQPVGYVRRAAYSFSLGASIARGYVTPSGDSEVDKEFLSTGKWEIEVMGERHRVSIRSEANVLLSKENQSHL